MHPTTTLSEHVPIDDVLILSYAVRMTLSARNQLAATVESVTLGDIMAHVVMRIGDQHVESVITRTSAESLNLKKGDTVRAIIKSTEVMIQKD